MDKPIVFEGLKAPPGHAPCHNGALCFYERGDFRPPLKGEWFLSGAIVQAYRAPNDLGQAFRIVRPVSFVRPGGPIPGDPVAPMRAAPAPTNASQALALLNTLDGALENWSGLTDRPSREDWADMRAKLAKATKLLRAAP